jgi:hypothetical protein
VRLRVFVWMQVQKNRGRRSRRHQVLPLAAFMQPWDLLDPTIPRAQPAAVLPFRRPPLD